MRQHVHTLRRFVRYEPRGFVPRLLKNSIRYLIQKYIYRNEFAIQDIHDYKMKLNLQDPGISRTLFLINDREREHAYLLRRITRQGSTVLDLGANIGYYALMESSLVGSTGRVLAVEPHPANFTLLTENIALNNRRNITPLQAAVSDRDASVTLHLSKLSNVHSLLPSVSHAAARVIQVPSRSLATLAATHADIDIIRMDIEGYETVILQSIFDLNKDREFTPALLFELHPKRYIRNVMTTLLEQLATLGYQVRYLATSDETLVRALGLSILTGIATDGKIRYVVEHISAAQATTLIPTARCVVLSTEQ